MLTSKSPQNGDIVSFRLSSGEEIVGKLVDQNDDTITLSKPISIGIQMVKPGQASIAFMPFMASVDDTGQFGFYKANIVTVPAKSREDVRASYVQATSSIALPNTGTASGLITP